MTVSSLGFGSRSYEEACYLHVQEYGLVNLKHKDNTTLRAVSHQSPNNNPSHIRRPKSSKCPKAGPGFKVTYLLTTWSKSPSWEVNRFQLVKKFPAFYWTRMFITALKTARHPSLSSARSIEYKPSNPTSWRCILILSSHLRLGLPSGFFPSGLFLTLILLMWRIG